MKMFPDFQSFRRFSTQKYKLKTPMVKALKYEEKQIQEMAMRALGRKVIRHLGKGC